MDNYTSLRLQCIVFALVSASFTNVYITQPVLPILQSEFAVDMVLVSFSVSAVILGIAISNLPFGVLADRIAIQPIVLSGGVMVAIGGLVCSFTENFWVFLGARFLQGLFIPCLTTCLAAYLAKTLPIERLNIVMGSYVSATVLGGLSGRLLGGWVHPPLHWRYAFLSAALLTIAATIAAVRGLPKPADKNKRHHDATGFWELLKRWDLLRMYLCAMGSFAIFSSVFNYLPYRLTAEPFVFSTEKITLLYLVYIIGIFIGPISGRISNRYGSGPTLLGGSVVLGGALGLILLPFIPAIIMGLLGLCGGFFTIHAAAVGALNRRLLSGQGRANALYVMFYYLGGWIGITVSGFVYRQGGWSGLITVLLLLLSLPISVGIGEYRRDRRMAERPQKS
jgi:MFS transporter, YNFM family, putative membrane transport protein